MPKTITQLTAASPADPNAVVAADNAAGTLTEKVTLQQIADLATPGIPAPVSPNQGDTLVYDTGNWIAQAPSSGLPAGMSDGDVLTYSTSSSAWVSQAPAAQVPTSASTNDILSWNGSAWVAIMPSTPGLPSGSAGQSLVYDGTNWVAGSPFPSASTGQYLYFDGTNWSGGSPLPTSGNTGDVLTYDSGTSTWSAQAPSGGISAPSMPSDGDVLTYDSATSAWVAEAPSGGGGLTAVFSKSSMDETAMGLTGSNSVTVAVQGSATYIVEGLALLEVPYGANDAVMSLRLSATTSDGNVWMDCDVAFDGVNNNWVVGTDFSQSTLTVANNADPNNNQTFPIRFRGWVETNAISSTNLAIHWGHSSGTYSITLKSGSWIKATRVL